jgi:hypothetical protein
MKRVLLTVAVALLIPSAVLAFTPMVGVYFDNGENYYTPAAPFTSFTAALYIIQSGYYVTGIEYSLETPSDPGHAFMGILDYIMPPSHSADLGTSAFSGQSITYWPPLTGFPTGYDLLVTYEMITFADCVDMLDYPIVVAPDPRSGFLRGTYTPDNEFFDIVPLTSILCPSEVGTEEESWGAIKSMYK